MRTAVCPFAEELEVSVPTDAAATITVHAQGADDAAPQFTPTQWGEFCTATSTGKLPYFYDLMLRMRFGVFF